MDNSTPPISDRSSTTNVNGSARRPSPAPSSQNSSVVTGSPGRPVSLMDSPNHGGGQANLVRVVVNKDEKGYGMKVSGDYPVYVQSVKEGGAAEKAGLHAGDKIIKVNGVNVMSSTHTEVVALIRSSSQVILTVQQRTGSRAMGSPSLHNRPLTTHSNSRITGPQPVDHEKQYQLQLEREQHYRLMIEKEQRYVDLLRSQIALSPDEKKCSELAKTEKNLQTLQAMLQSHIRSQNEQSPNTPNLDSPPPLPSSPPPKSFLYRSKPSLENCKSPNGNTFEIPPPLPKRNRTLDSQNNKNPSYVNGKVPLDTNSTLAKEDINSNEPLVDRDRKPAKMQKSISVPNSEVLVHNSLYSDFPPPLPPRAPLSAPGSSDPDAVNSLNKQLSYPLVATCATLVNNYSPNHTHHRTKSSPESLTALSPAEASKKLIASESMNDLSRQEGWDTMATPPGTPPPPYPSPLAGRRQPHSNRSSANTDDGDGPFEESPMESSSTEVSPLRGTVPSQPVVGRVVANSCPILAASPQTTQQPIISMEDDEISDQEIFEEHGPFRSLARLWESTPHLAVFTNYVLSNSDPNSLLFYLLTDLYKEGNAKEMRKWAFEIHSCFLVPGAPLRLSNVDENVAREIDNELMREYDREEILRRIFWKARNRAKEELTKQLVDFQQKRTAGLGTIFGPNDAALREICHDKAKEVKLYESLFLDKLEPYLDEVEKENHDPKRYYTAAALATVITRIFGVRPSGHTLDRCPTFVSKEKYFRTKLIGRYSRKLNVQGHQFVAQIYYTVVVCNNCHQIIYGIGPQGYQCSVCLINVHRPCAKLYDDVCPGPINKKDRGLGKFIRIRHDNNDNRRRVTGTFIQMEKERRQAEEKDNGVDLNESGETKPGHPVTRTGSDRRPDAVREESSKSQDNQDHSHDKHEDDRIHPDSTSNPPASAGNKRRTTSNINRSESVKEQSEKEKRKQRRNISDPLHNTTKDRIDLESQELGTNSGSSSNSSLSSNSRLSESPSNNSTDAALGGTNAHPTGSEWDSDMEVEADYLPDWQSSVPPDKLASLHPHEKKRQDVINELFHTERSHVKNLKVLATVFMKPLSDKQCLKSEELNLVFPNLNEILDIHNKFNSAMKSKRKEEPIVGEVGDILIYMFDGTIGEQLQRAAATFCERQQAALEFIKEKRKKDSKFDTTLSDCEKNNLCRRLNLQGIITTQMQRLSKYPLLLERLIDSVEKSLELDGDHWHSELIKLKQAHDRSREILNHVNEAVKLSHNRARLEEIQKHLDTTNFEKSEFQVAAEYKNLDLTNYKLIYEGDMLLKRPSKSPLQVHIVLLEEAVVLLQREGEKYLLKFFQTGVPGQLPLAPIIKMNTLLFRANAVSKESLYIVNTSSSNIQMYDLQVRDRAERKVWFKHLSDATEAYKNKEGKPKNSDHSHEPEEETVQELPTSSREPTERAEAVGGSEATPAGEDVATSENNQSNEVSESEKDKRLSHSESESCPSAEICGGGVMQSKIAADDWPLIQPSEVQVAVPPVLTAESRLTPLEQIRRKDEEVRQALAAKEGLVADLLSIPREDFHHIADMAGEDTSHNDTTERDSTEFVLAPMYQVTQLLEAVNDSLNISDTDPVLATGGKNPSCASNEALVCNKNDHVPSVPAHKIRDIATTLSSQLTTLLSVVKQADAEREMLRKELHRLREQFHERNGLHGPVNTESDNTCSMDSTQSSDLERIEESPTENES